MRCCTMEVRGVSRWYSLHDTGFPAVFLQLDANSSELHRRISGSASGEIVAADRLIEGIDALRRARNAGPDRRCADTFGLDERAQDGQRQVRVTGLDRLIEPIGKLAFPRQRAVPFAVV